MENEMKQVIKCILFDMEAPSAFSSEETLLKELKQQTMLSVIGSKIQRLPFSQKGKTYALQSILQHYAFAQRLLYEQSLLINLLQENEIPMVILKGTAAAMNYPEPGYRTFGDVDFLVSEENYQKAYQLMLKHGYTLLYDEDHVDYHYTLEKNHIIFELHRYPAGLPEGKTGEYIMKRIQAGLVKPDTAEVEGYPCPVLPAVENGLVLLLHIRKHLQGGLGLRQICDWMMFVKKHLNDKAWREQYQTVLRESGLELLAKTVTRMCQTELGLNPELCWCRTASRDLCNELWKYIMEKGNFGRKEGYEDKAKHFAEKNISNPVLLLQKFQRDGLQDWKAAKRYHWLRPFAWIHQFLYYASYAIRHRRQVLADIKIGKKRARMIRRLM